MKVISLNTWGGRCGDSLLEWIAENPADIYCFQELFSAPTLEPKKSFHIDNNDLKVNLRLFQIICNLLPNYKSFFSSKNMGYVNDSEWVDLPFEYGIGIFVSPKVEVMDYEDGTVYGNYRCTSLGKPPLSRTAQAIRCRQGNEYFTLGHIHGLWEPKGKMDTPSREDQAKKFGRIIDSIAKPKDAILACGDFNLERNSRLFVDSKFELKRNMIVENDIKSTRTFYYKKNYKYADYVIANNYTYFENFAVPQEPAVSDHCPLIFTIEQSKSEHIYKDSKKEVIQLA